MISYSNYVTTPSGRECSLKEIKNAEYFVLLKFIQAHDYSGFYSALDSLILETIPDFDSFHIVDKAYVYLAACFYSIHNTIITEQTVLGPVESSLVILLDALEQSYAKLPKTYSLELTPSVRAELTLPTRLLLTHSEITVDYSTGLSKIKDVVFQKPEERAQFISQIDPRFAIQIDHAIRKQFSAVCFLFGDVSVNLASSDIFYLIFQIYAENLDDFYELMYYCFEYFKWSFETFKQFTPLETRILFNQFKTDKERQAKERQQSLNN